MRLSQDSINAIKAKRARFHAAAKRRKDNALLKKQALQPPTGPRLPARVIWESKA